MTVNLSSDLPRSLFSPIASVARRFGRFMMETSDLMRCKREAERLFSMSDAELARRGLTRDRVIQHAFAGYLSA